jgi:hypothetical protein
MIIVAGHTYILVQKWQHMCQLTCMLIAIASNNMATFPKMVHASSLQLSLDAQLLPFHLRPVSGQMLRLLETCYSVVIISPLIGGLLPF